MRPSLQHALVGSGEASLRLQTRIVDETHDARPKLSTAPPPHIDEVEHRLPASAMQNIRLSADKRWDASGRGAGAAVADAVLLTHGRAWPTARSQAAAKAKALEDARAHGKMPGRQYERGCNSCNSELIAESMRQPARMRLPQPGGLAWQQPCVSGPHAVETTACVAPQRQSLVHNGRTSQRHALEALPMPIGESITLSHDRSSTRALAHRLVRQPRTMVLHSEPLAAL